MSSTHTYRVSENCYRAITWLPTLNRKTFSLASFVIQPLKIYMYVTQEVIEFSTQIHLLPKYILTFDHQLQLVLLVLFFPLLRAFWRKSTACEETVLYLDWQHGVKPLCWYTASYWIKKKWTTEGWFHIHFVPSHLFWSWMWWNVIEWCMDTCL